MCAGWITANRFRGGCGAPAGGGDRPRSGRRAGCAGGSIRSPRGDPQSPLRWTTKSTAKLAAELTALGHRVSARTVAKLLKQAGYSLQANSNTLECAQHPDRDAQFGYLNTQVERFQAYADSVISVDTKKEELVGNYKAAGREWELAAGMTSSLSAVQLDVCRAVSRLAVKAALIAAATCCHSWVITSRSPLRTASATREPHSEVMRRKSASVRQAFTEACATAAAICTWPLPRCRQRGYRGSQQFRPGRVIQRSSTTIECPRSTAGSPMVSAFRLSKCMYCNTCMLLIASIL